jgi:glutathione synthase/RimK-type ligase-like ATP-grasp enzyme
MQHDAHSWGRFLVDAVRSYTEKHSINFELFSGDWIMRLEKEGVIKYLFGNDFGLNNTATRGLCNDKSAAYQVLTREGIPALEHRILLRPGSLGAPKESAFMRAKQILSEYNNALICKPNNGSGGSDVVFIDSIVSLESTLIEHFGKHRALTLSPFVDITAEYRVCVLDDQVQLIYEKVREGDALQHNLSHGATAREVEDKSLTQELSTLARRAAKAVHATFVHVDIISVGGALQVLEINSGIMFEHYSLQDTEKKQKATEIYHKALDLLLQN